MELNQEALFSKKEKEVVAQVEKKLNTESSVPSNYIEINLISGKNLNVPVLHFRNYTMEEILYLGSSTQEKFLYNLIYKALNKMCYEDFDCANLTTSHIVQIMLTIFKNFWGSKLLNKPYLIDVNKPASKDNIAYVDIDIDKLDALYLPDNFKEPFTIIEKSSNRKIKFTLQKIKDVFFADNYIKEMYREKDNEYSVLENKLRLRKALEDSEDIAKQEAANKITITNEEKEAFEEYELEKARMYARVLQSQLIHSIDGVELKTIDEKLDAYSNKVDASTWKFYNTQIEEFPFGINSKYSFIDNEGNSLVRGFSFRFMELLPSMDKETDERFTICFDD